jgi:hypothetical protein
MSYGLVAALLGVATVLCGGFSACAWGTGRATPPPINLSIGDRKFIWSRWMIWAPLTIIVVLWVSLGADIGAARPVIMDLRSYASIAAPWLCVWVSAATYIRLKKNVST